MYDKGFTRAGILFRHAREDDSDLLVKLYSDEYKGGYKVPECSDPEKFRQAIKDESLFWAVAVSGDKIVGAGVARPELWNRSYETCRTVIADGFKSMGFGQVLYNMTLQFAFSRGDCDFAYGYPRSSRMAHVVSKSEPPMELVGHDAGMHMINGQREVCMVSVAYNPFKKIKRVVTKDIEALCSSSLGFKGIVDKFDFDDVLGEYPSRIIVGPKADGVFRSGSGSLSYADFDACKCVFITDVDAKSARDVRDTISEFLESDLIAGRKMGYVSFLALADKLDALSALTVPFRGGKTANMTAYLPAWYSQGDRRFDCVYMALRLDDGSLSMHGTQGLVASFDEVYSTSAKSPVHGVLVGKR